MKKLLFIVNVDWFFVSHRLPIAIEAIEQGYEVHLACTFTGKKEYLESLGVTCHDVAFSRSGSQFKKEIATLFALRKLIVDIDVDIVHSVTIKPVIYSGLAIRTLQRKPVIVAAISGLGYVFSANSWKAKLTKRFVSYLYKLALDCDNKRIIFQNNSDLSTLSKIVKLDQSDIALIKGSGADLSVYDFVEESRDTRKIVSMACRLLKDKGVYQFVEAAKAVRKERSDTEFWLIGSIDPENPNSVTQSEIESWVQQGIIRAFGHRDDIPALFAKSHIVTMPSFYGEGIPKVLIEAAACGRAIVTTDNAGCRDAVVNEVTGLIVPVKDAETLASAFSILLSDDKKRMEMGIKAREFAVKEFDVNNVVSKHLDIYESLMTEKI
ncbi:glycosyltransferase family 4 protein [Vibrio sp. PNB22_2_2]